MISCCRVVSCKCVMVWKLDSVKICYDLCNILKHFIYLQSYGKERNVSG